MHSKSLEQYPPKLFFQMVKDNFADLYMEDYNWDLNVFIDQFFQGLNGTDSNTTGKSEYLRQTEMCANNKVQGLEENDT
eukprot:UN16576